MTDATDHGTYSVDVGLNGNLGATLRVAPEASESGVAVVEHTLAPGRLAAPLHRHTHEDEVTFVLEGEMGIQEGGRDDPANADVSTVAAGEFAVKARGRWHTFWNPGPDPLRFFEVIAPGAFARYFEEAAELLPDGDSDPDEETVRRLGDLHAEYGFEVDPGSVPALLERHGLDG